MSYRLNHFSLISNVYYIEGNDITFHSKLFCNFASYMRQRGSLVRPADAYMTQTVSLLLQIMVCRLPRTKSLLKPVMNTCKLYPTGTNFHEIKEKCIQDRVALKLPDSTTLSQGYLDSVMKIRAYIIYILYIQLSSSTRFRLKIRNWKRHISLLILLKDCIPKGVSSVCIA